MFILDLEHKMSKEETNSQENKVVLIVLNDMKKYLGLNCSNKHLTAQNIAGMKCLFRRQAVKINRPQMSTKVNQQKDK